MPILSSQMTHLWDALCAAYRVLGFESATKATTCFATWCWRGSSNRPARSTPNGCSPKSEPPASYATIKRRLPGYAQTGWRPALAAACAAHAGLGPAWLVLFDVSTLYFETDAGDGFREPGFSNYAEVPVMPRSWWL